MNYKIIIVSLATSFVIHNVAYAGFAFDDLARQYAEPRNDEFIDQNKQTNSLALKKHGIDVLFGRIVEEGGGISKNKLHDEATDDDEGTKDDISNLMDELSLDYNSERTSTGHHILFAVVMARNINLLKSIIEEIEKNGNAFQGLDRYGNNVLHLCCALGWESGVDCILQCFSDNYRKLKRAVLARNNLRKSPYEVAKRLNNSAILKKFGKIIDKRNDTLSENNYNDYDDDDYYDKSSNENKNSRYVNEVSALLGYDKLFTLMMLDCKTLTKRLLSANKNNRLLTMKLDSFGNTIVHLLVMFGKKDVLNEIIGSFKNADYLTVALNDTNYHGDTPMHIAVSKNDLDTVLELLSYHEINLAILNDSDVTPLMLGIRNYKQYKSCKQDGYEIIHNMIFYKQSNRFPDDHLSVCDRLGNTPYHLASMQVSLKIIADLIEAGVDVQLLNNKNQTGGDKLAIRFANRDENIGNNMRMNRRTRLWNNSNNNDRPNNSTSEAKKASIVQAIKASQHGDINNAIKILRNSSIRYEKGSN